MTAATPNDALRLLSSDNYKHIMERNCLGSARYNVPPSTTNSKGCWLSSKTKHSRGYVRTKIPIRRPNGYKYEPYLHVVAFLSDCREIDRKRILNEWDEAADDPAQISHLCHNKACFNPDHLVNEGGDANNDRNMCKKLKIIICECGRHHNPCPHEPPCILE